MRRVILEKTDGSITELRKLKHQLRSKAFSKGGTPQDRKMVSIIGDLLKKKEREEMSRESMLIIIIDCQ